MILPIFLCSQYVLPQLLSECLLLCIIIVSEVFKERPTDSMQLSPEVIRVLEREKLVSAKAIHRLNEQTEVSEREYNWTTKLFLQKFNSGEIEDEQEFFQWYALAEAVADWKNTLRELEAALDDVEVMNA